MSLFRDAIFRSDHTGIFAPALLRSPQRRVPDVGVDLFFNIDGGIARYDARTLQLANGAPVDAWGDISGQMSAAVQDVAAQRPTYTANMPGVAFPGGEHHLRLPPELEFSEVEAWTIFLLGDRQSTISQTWIARGSYRWGLAQVTNGRATWYAGGQSAGLSAIDSWPLGRSVLVLSSDGSSLSGYRDGVELLPPRVPGPDQGGSEPATLGCRIDSKGQVDLPLQGVIHDLLFFNRALSPVEINELSTALASDWGI